MTVHQDKLQSLLTRAMQEILARGLNDPRVRGLVSVTAVQVSPDMANATVKISVIPAEHGATTLHGLRHATAHLRTEIGNRVRLRRMPQLRFELDEGLKRQAEVFAAIARTGPEPAELTDEEQGASDLQTGAGGTGEDPQERMT